MVVFLVDPTANPQHNDHIGQHEQVKPDGGDGSLDDNLPEVTDKEIHRIQEKQVPHHGGVIIDGVEDSGHVHQQLGENTPEILDIPEENEQGGEDQPHPDVEQNQHADGVEQADQLPGEGDVVQDTEYKEHTQGQAEVDEGLHVLGEEEEVLGHVDLGEDAGVAHEGGHTLTGGLVEVGEDQVAAEQIGGVMRGMPAKKLRENQPHDQKGQQRGEHAPGHAQHRAFVFLFEVPFYQLLEEELVFF